MWLEDSNKISLDYIVSYILAAIYEIHLNDKYTWNTLVWNTYVRIIVDFCSPSNQNKIKMINLAC